MSVPTGQRGARRRRAGRGWAGALAALAGTGLCAAQNSAVHTDPAGDAALRRTDLGNDGAVPPGHLPDVLEVRLSGWLPGSIADSFSGATTPGDMAHVFRLDVVFAGLVNPSGPVGLGGEGFDPLLFGPKPLVGFFELDIDDEKNTGGELIGEATQHVLANVARFGGVPYDSDDDRVATSAEDYDFVFSSDPQFERSGDDFTLVLCGCETPQIVGRTGGNQDDVFEEGETWVVRGRFFERARGYAPASGVFGGSDFGFYDPVVNLRFSHSIADDRTTVSLVFALDMSGAATLTGQPQQAMDSIIDLGGNHASIEEAVADLINAAGQSWSDPVRAYIRDWRDRDSDEHLDPTDWKVQFIVGTPYAAEAESLYAWTDAGLDLTPGDFDGSGDVGPPDRAGFDAALAELDGCPSDGDGAPNGRFQIVDFGYNFSLYDVNADGVVDCQDVDDCPATCPGDLSGASDPNDPGYGVPDGSVDGSDFFYYLDQFVAGNMSVADLTGSSDPNSPSYGVPDGAIDGADFFVYLDFFVEGC
ncbi:MAG: hypothetical protein IT439_08705 [Phycisphaerales bacterium]|nr:hypothetical protein [Phycisphaerales bacterium]